MILNHQPVEEMTAPEIMKEAEEIRSHLHFLEEPENYYQDGERTAEEAQGFVSALEDRLKKLETALRT
jgi:exonuclease VII small subunit